MARPRLYCPGLSAASGVFILPESAAHHAARVLRLREGDAVTLFGGSGGEYAASILGIDRREVSVTLGAHSPTERESPLRVTLVQALQAGDRMDVTVQKAVELGAVAIVPVAARRSVLRLDGERAAKRLAHWRQIVVAACEQCGRNTLPEICAIESLERWLARPAAGALRLFLSPHTCETLQSIPPARDVELLVGPEGGLAPEEVSAAEAAGFRPLRLGPRVLRTETAGMAALAALQARWGDFG